MSIVIVNALHNAYLDYNNQNTNYGQSDIKLIPTNPIFALVRFNYGSNTTVNLQGAKMRLYLKNSPANAEVSIYRCTSDWSEMIVTWNTQPTISAAPCGKFVLTTDANKYYSADIAELGELKSTIGTNYGFMLKITSGGGVTATDFIGRNGVEAQVPHLDLYYSRLDSPAYLSDYGAI